MILFRYLLFALLIINSAFADELKMKNGRVYKNIRIVSVEYSTIIIYFNNERQFIPIMDVEEWSKQIQYDQTQPGEIYENDILIVSGDGPVNPCKNTKLLELAKKKTLTEQEIREYKELKSLCDKYKMVPITLRNYSNLPFLPLGIAGLIGGYHLINKGLDQQSEPFMFSRQARHSTENVVAGIICAAGGVALTIFALKPVEVTVQPDMVSLTLKF